jgi:hypothetical protein
VVARMILDSNRPKNGRVAAPKAFMLGRRRTQKECRSISY